MQQNSSLNPKLGWYPELGHFIVSYREKLRKFSQRLRVGQNDFAYAQPTSNQFLLMLSQQ